jgi:hypothetical protein
MQGMSVRRVPYVTGVSSGEPVAPSGASAAGADGAVLGAGAGPPDIERPSTSTRKVRWISTRAQSLKHN